MHTQLSTRCPNRQCPRARWGPATSTAFCSHQCAYLYTLGALRQSVTACARQDAAAAQRTQPPLLGKSHTFMLVRCGIDPWAPPAEIRMRQQSCRTLILVLGRYSQSPNVADYAWPLENMSYCLSHHREYAGHWVAVADASSSTQRYHLLCVALMQHIETNVPYVRALLGGHIHPSEFYAGVFVK
ncbi:hypothetical protein H4R19_001906 [Coemansia spiralis]|nr:hypothetical protein H4R19_001906 [Coemansia spiralis]